MTPTHTSRFLAAHDNLQLQLAAILNGSRHHPSSTDTGWLRVTGDDRVRWLNGMVTNSVQALAPGEGNYNFLLNAQGRILGDCTIFAEPDDATPPRNRQPPRSAASSPTSTTSSSWTTSNSPTSPTTRTGTPHRRPARIRAAEPNSVSAVDKPRPAPPCNHATVACQPPSPSSTPTARSSPASSSGPTPPAVAAPPHRSHTPPEQSACDARSPRSPPHPRRHPALRQRHPQLRDSQDLPQETHQTRALHFNKGCYLGQEIVERIRSRGQVHRTFTAFRLTGTLPPAGTPSKPTANPVGELTTVARIPLPDGDQIQLALGYVRREALDRNLPLHYPGGTATPIQLPYSDRRSVAPSIRI